MQPTKLGAAWLVGGAKAIALQADPPSVLSNTSPVHAPAAQSSTPTAQPRAPPANPPKVGAGIHPTAGRHVSPPSVVSHDPAAPAKAHPFRHAALAHIELAGIHPFVDGNGRVARMLVNLLLLRDAYPPALYTMTNRAEYLRTLELAQFRGETEPFVRVTAEATRFMVERYVHAIEQTRQAEAQGVAPTPPRDQDRDPGR